MITNERSTKSMHECIIVSLVGDLLLKIAFAMVRWHSGYIAQNDPAMAPARRMLCYKMN